jgi:hypothetical protein
MNLDALGRAAFGGFLADFFEFGRDFINDNLGGIAIHFENLGAKIATDLVSSAQVFVYGYLHFVLLSSHLSSFPEPSRSEGPQGGLNEVVFVYLTPNI